MVYFGRDDLVWHDVYVLYFHCFLDVLFEKVRSTIENPDIFGKHGELITVEQFAARWRELMTDRDEFYSAVGSSATTKVGVILAITCTELNAV